ncbi:MBOAT family protein [Candidatus Woesearchaeota archaeon]|nr:MBOAT family protein [Candidatus Woesearchaeota archaeon]
MLFNSLAFLIFFPVVTGLYFIVPHRFRWFLLLAASSFFYMSFIPVYILILALLIVIDFFAGVFIEDSAQKRRKLFFLIASLISTCAVLFVFKYFNFFNANFAYIAEFLHWNYSIESLKIILPIGLSFHTFQSLSYVIEVYRGRQKAERNFGIYALYVMFYPQLVAGPIERPQNLLHQFYEEHYFDYKRVVDGLRLMLWGLFKKIVIADNIAVVVNTVYNNPTNYSGIPLIMATVLFAFQIFCDFSGYSDIAIGSAQVMGFKLMKNFDRPYFAKSVSEFWRRWHISLSTWFKDYVYISLGGSRVSLLRKYFNVFVVFLISGFWHGANWTFIIWGSLHGLYLLISLTTASLRERVSDKLGLGKIPKFRDMARIGITFSLVAVGWVFFRANSLSDAWYIITHLFANLSLNLAGIKIGTNWNGLLIIVGSIFFMEFVHVLQEYIRIKEFFSDRSLWIRWSVYFVLVWAIILLGAKSTDFIYFQF